MYSDAVMSLKFEILIALFGLGLSIAMLLDDEKQTAQMVLAVCVQFIRSPGT